jgi:hypothetical protein
LGNIILMFEEFCMRKTTKKQNIQWVFGILAALLAVLLAGCFNPADLQEEDSKAFEPTAVTFNLLTGPEASFSPSTARSVAGFASARIKLTGIRNYVQVVVVDTQSKQIAGYADARKKNNGEETVTLDVKEVPTGKTYSILYLAGHWERNYGAEWFGGDYAYTDNPPTLLTAGISDPLYFTQDTSVTITIWPISVDTSFTGAAGTVEPVVTNGRPAPVLLSGTSWNANWKVIRPDTATSANGFHDLLRAQQVVNSAWTNLQTISSSAVILTPTGTVSAVPTVNGNVVSLSLAGYSGNLAANFALQFVPYNLSAGWTPYDNAAPWSTRPVWVVRNGLNDSAQNDYTDFVQFGQSASSEQYNGNGAVRFSISNSPIPPPGNGKITVNPTWGDGTTPGGTTGDTTVPGGPW